LPKTNHGLQEKAAIRSIVENRQNVVMQWQDTAFLALSVTINGPDPVASAKSELAVIRAE